MNLFRRWPCQFVILATVFGSGISGSSGAETYYVSPEGSDGQAGTKVEPFATVNRAYRVAEAGDTILLRGGVYRIKEQILCTRQASADRPITIARYKNEEPVIDATAMTATGAQGNAVYLYDAAWHILDGLTVRHAPECGVLLAGDSSHNVVSRLKVSHSGRLSQWEGKGIVYIGSGSNNLFLNNDSFFNQDLRGDNADGFSFVSTGGGNIARGNRAWSNSDDGFDLFNALDDTKGAPWTLEDNLAWENGFTESGEPLGEGHGFKLGGKRNGTASQSGGHLVRGNLSWKNRRSGFNENGACLPMRIIGNTAYKNGTEGFRSYTAIHLLKQNVSLANGKEVSLTPGTDNADNSWALDRELVTEDFVTLDDRKARGPRAANGSLPETPFLTLKNPGLSLGRLDADE